MINIATALAMVSFFFHPTPEKHIAKMHSPKGIKKIGHIIVLYLENHSFDNLYGEFPGADGLTNATPSNYTQVDTATGRPYALLPWNDNHFRPSPVLPNKYFNIDQFLPPSDLTIDLVHRYYQEIAQIDGGKMDNFAAISSANTFPSHRLD